MKASFIKAGIRFIFIACAIALTTLSAMAQQANAASQPWHPTGRFMKAVLALHLSTQQRQSIDAYVKLAHKSHVATVRKMHRSVMNVLTSEQRSVVRAKLHKSSQTFAPSPRSDGIPIMHQYTSTVTP
jgi:hypothetical protein